MMRRRNRQRGAAMAEMVILAPVMILMWFGIDYFRSGYARRLEALADSHKRAWALAYSNDGSCFANKEPWSGFTGEAAAQVAGGGLGTEAVETFKSKTSSSMFMYAHANVQATWSTKAARFQGNAVGAVRGGTYVACNEVVPKADQDVITPLYDFVRSLF